MKKILIIGKRGFIGKNLAKSLNKKLITNHISFDSFLKKTNIINNYDYVINTSINKDYLKKKYNKNFDNDLKISNFIKKKNIIHIFLSTRKIYKPNENIRENSPIKPKCNYSKNKLITEKKLLKKIKKNLIILRISNIIGYKKKIKKIHTTFIDTFFNTIQKGYVVNNETRFKDFISIDKFCEIVYAIIKNNIKGLFNVSIGEKIYLNELILWLNKHNKKKLIIKKNIYFNNDSFYLNNKKLMSKINIKNKKSELKKFCINLSKKYFLEH